jgi:hypothetical protein
MKLILAILILLSGVTASAQVEDSLYYVAPKTVFTFDSTAYFSPEELQKETNFINIIRHYDSLLYLKLLPTGDFKVVNILLLEKIFSSDKKSEHLSELARALHGGFKRRAVEFYEYTYERPVFYHYKSPIGIYVKNNFINENQY